MVKGRNEEKKAELEKNNFLAYLQGIYMAEAIASTVGNMFKKKSAKPHEYPKKPFELGSSKPLTNNDIQEQRKLFVAKLQTMKNNFDIQKQGQ